MAWTDAETNRIEAIEDMLNKLQVAINNLASKKQMQQLLLLKQNEIDSLTQRVVTLESQITLLQNLMD
jgi:polyhydroxyalkanoate synthesis regulator phasin